MEMAKSFFGTRDHDGYVGKEEHSVNYYYLYKQGQLYTADC